MRVSVSILSSLLAGIALASAAHAQAPAPAPAPSAAAAGVDPNNPDDSLLGTVEITGSAGLVLPKIAVIPLKTKGAPDALVQDVVRRDLELSGEYDVADPSLAPGGPYEHETAIDAKALQAWRATGHDLVVRVAAETSPAGKLTVEGQIFEASKGASPIFTRSIDSSADRVRFDSHRLVDALLGALTGRPGGFASYLVYTTRVGRGRAVYTIDSDGAGSRSYGYALETAWSPTFGPRPPGTTAPAPAPGEPEQEIWFTQSQNYGPFRLVHGPDATPVPLSVPGSILGVSFSPDAKKLALAVMHEGQGQIWVGSANGTGLAALQTGPLASQPAHGPLGKLAWVAGEKIRRVYVDGKPVSPAGFSASAPTFCDSKDGLLVIFTIGFGAAADIFATDTNGGHLRRLTQHQGHNTFAACSPDGRMVSFFSNRKGGSGPGIYQLPIGQPWRAKRVSGETGEWLRWSAASKG